MIWIWLELIFGLFRLNLARSTIRGLELFFFAVLRCFYCGTYWLSTGDILGEMSGLRQSVRRWLCVRSIINKVLRWKLFCNCACFNSKESQTLARLSFTEQQKESAIYIFKITAIKISLDSKFRGGSRCMLSKSVYFPWWDTFEVSGQ